MRISGRGERVEPAEPVGLDLLLVLFDFGVRTADAYRWWDEDGGPKARDDPYPNDLEEPVIRRHPRIAEAKRTLTDGGATAAVMSGSGPTVFGVLPPESTALRARWSAEEPEAPPLLTCVIGTPVMPIRKEVMGDQHTRHLKNIGSDIEHTVLADVKELERFGLFVWQKQTTDVTPAFFIFAMPASIPEPRPK